ncbi:MAG: hypothetical protein AAGB04_14920, partial [Pseudomonadota bacterium]
VLDLGKTLDLVTVGGVKLVWHDEAIPDGGRKFKSVYATKIASVHQTAVEEKGPATKELRRRCAWLHRGSDPTNLPNTSLWRDEAPTNASSPRSSNAVSSTVKRRERYLKSELDTKSPYKPGENHRESEAF